MYTYTCTVYMCMHTHTHITHAYVHTQFAADIQLIYENCIEYNGDENEYSELAKETTKTFQLLFKQHIEGEVPIDEEGTSGKSKRGRKGRESRSPSACKTPELTSESSSDEEESDDRWALIRIVSIGL